MKQDVRPKRPLEEIARDIELRRHQKTEPRDAERAPASNAKGKRGRAKIIAAVAGIAVVFAAGWGIGRASPSSAWARAGVRARVPRFEPPALASVVVPDVVEPAADASVEDDAPPDGGSATDADGDALADLLAEAAARAKLADAGAAPNDVTGSSEDRDDGSARPPEPAATVAPRLGSATRMRQAAEQVIAICQSGHASEVQAFAAELLQEEPPPWLAKRIRQACFGTTGP